MKFEWARVGGRGCVWFRWRGGRGAMCEARARRRRIAAATLQRVCVLLCMPRARAKMAAVLRRAAQFAVLRVLYVSVDAARCGNRAVLSVAGRRRSRPCRVFRPNATHARVLGRWARFIAGPLGCSRPRSVRRTPSQPRLVPCSRYSACRGVGRGLVVRVLRGTKDGPRRPNRTCGNRRLVAARRDRA